MLSIEKSFQKKKKNSKFEGVDQDGDTGDPSFHRCNECTYTVINSKRNPETGW